VPELRTEIRVVHGNLGFARWPVAVGHYADDILSGSEEHLNRTLDGRLGQRRDLRLYPNRVESVEIVLDPERSPPGAVVVGLGDVGELAPGELRRTLAYAFRRYVLAMRERMPAVEDIGISTLVIGAGEGGIGIQDAVMSLLEAIHECNTALRRQLRGLPNEAAPGVNATGIAGLSRIDIVELYEDRAIQVAHAIGLVLQSERLKSCFNFDGCVGVGEGGRRRASVGEDPSWWRRLRIQQGKGGGLQFTDLTDRARAEVSLVADQRDLVDRFVRRAVNFK
jgi:hypothetical protein